MSSTNEPQIETIKTQQLVNDQAKRYRQILIRSIALLAGQELLRSSGKKHFKLARFAAGGGLLYLGLTGDIPLISWMERKNVNHSQYNFKKDILIKASLNKVYSVLNDFSLVVHQVPGVKVVKPLDPAHTHWEVVLELVGMDYVFELFIVKQKTDEFIGWSTGENSAVYHSGKVELSPGPTPELTKAAIVFSYTPPLGKVGQMIASPANIVLDYMVSLFAKRIKTLIESLEVV